MEVSKNHELVDTLQCELCREGYRAPQIVPDLVALRLKAEKLANRKKKQSQNDNHASKEGDGNFAGQRTPRIACLDRLFLSRLPLNVRRTQIQEWLQTPIHHIQWLTDRNTGAFYGSCIVQIDAKVASALVNDVRNKLTKDSANSNQTARFLGPFPGTSRRHSSKTKSSRQQPKVSGAFAVEGQVWPPEFESEFPPLGHCQ
jgi:hypothetical protein